MIHVSTLTVGLRFESMRTLRQKRRLVRGMVVKLRRHFNVAVVELGPLDRTDEAVLGVAAAGRSRAEAREALRHVAAALEAHPLAAIVRRTVEDLR
jgi:uncharacterized protein YlxP (DUF503 family)